MNAITNRINTVAILDTLNKYLDTKLAWTIFDEMLEKHMEDVKNQVGMKYGEWKIKFGDEHTLVWAADSHGGFGKKGWSVYGDADDLTIVRIDTDHHGFKTLHLWNTDLWGWDDLKA